ESTGVGRYPNLREWEALSSGYVVDSDLEKDEKDPKEDPADYPANRENNDEDESSNDDEDDADRKWGSNHNGSLSQQNKGHKVPRAHTAWPINKKAHAGSLPLCNQCKFQHNETYTVKCRDCKKVGHIIQNCRTPATAKNQRTYTCYECRSLRHYKEEIMRMMNHLNDDDDDDDVEKDEEDKEEEEHPAPTDPSDEPMEDQPLPADASPTALSPDYVVNSKDEKDPKEDPAYYPADRGNNKDVKSLKDNIRF
nr:hypothetical protein [Tanacetum cinerariifolium]